MTPAVGLHCVDLVISLAVTVFVGRALHHHGRPFLIDVFGGRVRLAEAANSVLLVGFYLTNSALVLLFVSLGHLPATWDAVITSLFCKLGMVLVTLGVMHFGNVAILLAVRWLLRHARRTLLS